MAHAFERGVYLRPNLIPNRQLLDFLDPEPMFSFRWWSGEKKDYAKELLLSLPESLSDLPVSEFLHLAVTVSRKSNPYLDQIVEKLEEKLLEHLLARAAQVNPANPIIVFLSQRRPPPHGCKKPIVDVRSMAFSCKAEDEILLKELFALP